MVILVCILSHLDWVRRDTEYSFQMRENPEQNNSEYRFFSCSDGFETSPQA